MSLETKISELTLKVADLTETINLLGNILLEGDKINAKSKQEKAPSKEKVEKSVTPPVEETIVDEVVEVSIEDLKAACIKASRSDVPDAKTKVKALLAKHGAKVVKDVAQADRVTIFKLLEENKF